MGQQDLKNMDGKQIFQSDDIETKVFIVTLTGDVDSEKLSKWAWAELPIEYINVTEVTGAKDVEIVSQQVQVKN